MTLEARLRQFDETRRGLMGEMAALNLAMLQATPIPGKWSILQILEHLVVAERAVFQGLPDPSGLVAGARGLRHHLRYALVMSVLRLGVPVRVPSREMAPRGGRELSELARMWDDNQQWLLTVAARLGSAVERAAVLAHPIAGPLTVVQGVRMGQVHVDRHIRQIRQRQRLLA